MRRTTVASEAVSAIREMPEDELDVVRGGRKGGGDVAMETIELAVETIRVQR